MSKGVFGPPRSYDDEATLILTPWAAQALSDDERHAIGVRAVDLHARVIVGKHVRGNEWVIRVSPWKDYPGEYVERRHYAGLHLADCIEAALGAFADTVELANDVATARGYTADELMQIAAQSNVAVSRA